jgi:hypothetical protein
MVQSRRPCICVPAETLMVSLESSSTLGVPWVNYSHVAGFKSLQKYEKGFSFFLLVSTA